VTVLLRRQKMVIAALVLYWPTLFVLAHIPVPQIVRRAHMYDKSLHLLAYMILTFLLWSAVRPREKVQWRRAAVWCLLAIVAVYGVCDECLQHFVADRSMDPRDLVADGIGAVTALALLTILPFWPTSVIIAGITIYTLAVFTRANLTALLPVTGAMFDLLTHAVFTLLWIGYLRQRPRAPRTGPLWALASASLPLILVVVTNASAMISGKAFEGEDIVAATAGILASIAAISLAGLLDRGGARNAILRSAEQ
jgi:VanZ family protein